MKMLVVICDRTLTNKIVKTLNQENVKYHISFYGRGTADQSILSYFGLEKTEKEVIMSIIDNQDINIILEKLSAYEFIKHHGAVAFTVPLDGISQNTLDYIKKMEEWKMKFEHELIITISNEGFVDEIMATAKKAGARGGTIVHGRGTVTEEAIKFFGLTIHPDKDILLIVTKTENKNDIMLAISTEHGVDKKPRAVCFSLPIIDVRGFSF